MKPRIFISAVAGEFETTRQRVANIPTRLGYEPHLEDIFGTEQGDLRQMLRGMIDDCDGLIQIVGDSYGGEPPTGEPAFDRNSGSSFDRAGPRAILDRVGCVEAKSCRYSWSRRHERACHRSSNEGAV